MRAITMLREMRDISGDLRERADLLVRQMVAEQVQFRTSLSELQKGKAVQRQRLEAALQAVHNLINVLTVRYALHRALNSAVVALDAQAKERLAANPLTQRKSSGS